MLERSLIEQSQNKRTKDRFTVQQLSVEELTLQLKLLTALVQAVVTVAASETSRGVIVNMDFDW